MICGPSWNPCRCLPTEPLSTLLFRLPAGTRGKAARIQVSRPAMQRPHAETLPRGPRTELERTITAIWQDLFQEDAIGSDENFFDLGGHSLLLLQAHSRIQAAVQAELPIVALFQYPTINSLARYLNHEADRHPTYQDVRDRAKRQLAASARQKRLVEKRRRDEF